MKNDPKTGERWTHPEFGVGTVTISLNGHIEVDFDDTYACYRAVKDFHKDGYVRTNEKI